MPQPDESGVLAVSDDGQWRRTIHGIIEAVAILAVNVEIIVESPGSGDQELLVDTRVTLDRLVTLAREAQRLRTSVPPAPKKAVAGVGVPARGGAA
jgi:hypothetical protein